LLLKVEYILIGERRCDWKTKEGKGKEVENEDDV
jgi:hypothetical protein